MGPISCHITPLVIIASGVETHTHTHANTHTHTHARIIQTFADRSNSKK